MINLESNCMVCAGIRLTKRVPWASSTCPPSSELAMCRICNLQKGEHQIWWRIERLVFLSVFSSSPWQDCPIAFASSSVWIPECTKSETRAESVSGNIYQKLRTKPVSADQSHTDHLNVILYECVKVQQIPHGFIQSFAFNMMWQNICAIQMHVRSPKGIRGFNESINLKWYMWSFMLV